MENTMNKMELLKQITSVDFMIEDLHLYLNTHPEDQDSVVKYNTFLMQSQALKQQYDRFYGMLSEHKSFSHSPWQWINEPWPWEYEANFKL